MSGIKPKTFVVDHPRVRKLTATDKFARYACSVAPPHFLLEMLGWSAGDFVEFALVGDHLEMKLFCKEEEK
jgi:hypothetical protein